MIINGIDTRDISVVVQGAVDKENTPLCLDSLHRYLPGAEIILSTWEKTKVDGLRCDEVLLNKDPGGFRDKFCRTFTNNTLRQLVSTQEGIKKASRRYILKMRSDLVFKSALFLKFFDDFERRNPAYIMFNHRVIFCSFFSKRFCSAGEENQPLPFHISDWLAFGFSEDVRYLFDIPFPNEPENTWYLSENKYITRKVDFLHCSHRYSPEQYIFFSASKKCFPEIQFEHYLDYDRYNIEWSEAIIANNCIILDPIQFKFYCAKKSTGTDRYKLWTKMPVLMPETLTRGLYTYREFQKDYNKYCEESYKGY